MSGEALPMTEWTHLVVGPGGVNLEDFLGCNLAQFLGI